MTDYREVLRDKAHEAIAGAAYNDLRRRRAEDEEAGADRVLFYEVAVPTTGAWDDFRDRTFPQFARWLRAQKLDPAAPRGVVVAAFLGDRCHLLDGPRFFDVLSEMEGLNPSALHFRVLQWLR